MEDRVMENAFVNQIMGFLYAVTSVLGIMGNGLVFLTFWKERRKSVFHMQLVVANIITLSAAVFSAPSALRGRWLFGDALCKWFGFQVSIATFAEMALTCVICIEAYLTICRAELYEKLREAVFGVTSFAVWGSSLLVSMAPFSDWNTYKIDHLSTSCGIDIESDASSSHSYLMATFIVSIVMTLVAVASLSLIFTGKSSDSGDFQPLLSNGELVQICTLLLVFFVIGCFPYYIRVIYFLRGFPPLFGSFLSVEVSHITLTVCSLLQPFAYMMVSETFKNLAIVSITGVNPLKKNA